MVSTKRECAGEWLQRVRPIRASLSIGRKLRLAPTQDGVTQMKVIVVLSIALCAISLSACRHLKRTILAVPLLGMTTLGTP